MIKKAVYPVIFLVAIIVMSCLYNYQSEIFLHPHGIHIWRQCDCAQFAINYYTESMNFFEPRLSMCAGNDGKMGSEFPIIYYSAAILYKIFGVHDWFIRIINLLIFFMGLFYLAKAIALFLDDKFYGLVLALMLFTSPILIDYANNFLPDVPALSLSFIGLYYFLSYTKDHRTRVLWKSTFFFAFAGLLKVTALMSFLCITGTLFFAALINLNNTTVFLKEHRGDWKAWLGFLLLPLLISGAWIVYIKNYNLSNNNGYFLTTIVPYWQMDSEVIERVKNMFEYTWLREFIYRDFTNTIPFIFLAALIIPYRKNILPVVWMSMLIVLGCIYVLLFFGQFTVHDYYLICLMPIPIGICAVFLLKLKGWKQSIFDSKIIKAAVLVLLLVMIHHGRRLNNHREEHESWSYYSEIYKIKPELASLGIKPNEKMISVGDVSSGISLYLLERRGWTNMCLSHPDVTENDFEKCIAEGAGFAVIADNADARITPEARNRFLQNQIKDYNGIKFYKL